MRPVVLPSVAKYLKASGAASNGRAAVLCISGEYVTFRDIGARLGVPVYVARNRVIRAQKAAGPVTWEALQAANEINAAPAA